MYTSHRPEPRAGTRRCAVLVELSAQELLAIHRGLGRLLDRQASDIRLFKSSSLAGNDDELNALHVEYDRTVALRIKVRNAMDEASRLIGGGS